MKESRFIELLNLYIDQQIPPGEAAMLEEEILNNPRRRRTYQQYCRMHRACTQVFENIRARAERPAADMEKVAGCVVDFEPRSSRSMWQYYAAGMAVAACVALVAVQAFLRPRKALVHGDLVTLPAASPTSARSGLVMASGPWRMETTVPQMSLQTGSFVAQRLLMLSPAGYQGNAPVIIASSPAANTPDRGTPGTLLRPSIEQFVFEQAPSISNTPPTFRNRQQLQEQSEMTAFQFQR